jgi:cyclopropane fatty-acyl-phospholipid synthase-like methyltransferase
MNSNPAEDIKVSAIFSIDLIEHIDPENEDTFMSNMIQSYENKENAVMIIGTPNVTAAQYASPVSAEGHINLKSHDDLKALLQRHFHNVFMFGMNDEVVHTGYAPMCHYLWGIGAGLK